MKAMVVIDRSGSGAELSRIVREKLKAEILLLESLQAAIEHCEVQEETVDLVICDYRGRSFAVVQMLVELIGDLPCVLVAKPDSRIARDIGPAYEESVAIADPATLSESVAGALDRLKEAGAFDRVRTPDSDFVRLSARALAESTPIRSDVFVRLSADRYVKLFREGDAFTAQDVETYLLKRNVDYFYVRKDQSGEIAQRNAAVLEGLEREGQLDATRARAAVSDALEIVQELVDKLGFTPEAQEVARKSVQVTLRVIGDDPKLIDILDRLRRQQGRYITSHSIMLAEIACAVAHAIGWRSSGTYLKLTLAAFLHDLSLTDNGLARVRTLQGDATLGLTRHDLHLVRLHPAKAAELSRTFADIPPDVDTIITQHHERGDGTGFPRGLFHQQIHPLACLFIIAQDLLNFFMDGGPDGTLEGFLAARGDDYRRGTLKKIAQSLKMGALLT